MIEDKIDEYWLKYKYSVLQLIPGGKPDPRPEDADPYRRRRRRMARHPVAACVLGAALFAHLPCCCDLDGDHTIETNFEEIRDLLSGGPRWTELQRLIYRYSDDTNRNYLKSPLKA